MRNTDFLQVRGRIPTTIPKLKYPTLLAKSAGPFNLPKCSISEGDRFSTQKRTLTHDGLAPKIGQISPFLAFHTQIGEPHKPLK